MKGIAERICSCCGKSFIPSPQHAYKLYINRKVKWCCSYRCYRNIGGDGGKVVTEGTYDCVTVNKPVDEGMDCMVQWGVEEKGGNNMKTRAPENNLRKLRNLSKLTLQEVSLITGFDISTISNHESGRRSMSNDVLIKYANLYKVQTHELFVLE